MKSLYSLLIASFSCAAIILIGCKDESLISLPPEQSVPCDTCGNYLPISSSDSIGGFYPSPVYDIYDLQQSQYNGWCAGFYACTDILKFGMGVFLYDPLSCVLKLFMQNAVIHEFSNSGEHLLLGYVGGPIAILDLRTFEFKRITDQEFYNPQWSLDEEYIYASRNFELYKIRLSDETTFRITGKISGKTSKVRQINDSTFVCMLRSGPVFYHLKSDSLEQLFFTGMPTVKLFHPRDWDLSHDKTKILVDNDADIDRAERGIYLFNITSKTVKMVVKGQNWFNNYHPRWSSNNSFFGSYFCRKDSASMIYEYDLNGNVLRQVTFKDMKLYP